MTMPATDYAIAAADAEDLLGVVLAPADIRLQALERMAAVRAPDAMLNLFAQVLGMANAVAENCRTMVELILLEEGMHPHDTEKANLPTMFGALQGVLLADGIDPRGTCASCAYRLGTPANTSPITTTEASYCQSELQKFFCHAEFDEQGEPIKQCIGHAKALKHRGTT